MTIMINHELCLWHRRYSDLSNCSRKETNMYIEVENSKATAEDQRRDTVGKNNIFIKIIG